MDVYNVQVGSSARNAAMNEYSRLDEESSR